MSLQTVHRRALATATRVVEAAGAQRSCSRDRDGSRCAPRSRARRRGGLRGPRTGGPFPSPRHRRAVDGAALRRGRFRRFGFDHSVRLRPAGALRRPSPENVHHAVGAGYPERAYYHCDACRSRGACPRDQALGLQGTSLSPTVERTVEALGCEIAADERDVAEPLPSPAPTMYHGLDGTGRAGAPHRGRRSPRQAARRFGQDQRGQAGHRVDGRNTRQTRPAPP